MKIKERGSLITKQGTLDVTSARKIFKNANEFIKKLLQIVPFPSAETDEVGGGDADGALLTKTHHAKVKVFGEGTRAKSLEELHKKFEALKGKKKNYRDKLEMKGLRNRIKKKKEDKKEQRRLGRKLLKKQNAGPEFVPKSETLTSKPTKPVYNKEGKMVFSKFDFCEYSTITGQPQKTFSSDPKAMLKRLDKQTETIKRLEERGDPEKVLEAKERFAWQRALDMAEGKKYKDDRALLVKSIKKMETRKKKTKTKLNQREEEKNFFKERKLKKKAGNIEKRKTENKKSKIKKTLKKGRVIIK